MPDPRDQRTRSRIRLTLPVRIRQVGPPRDLVEVNSTLDVSRNGILFRTRQPYDVNSTIWITMPYHAQAAGSEPEFPASVVRIDRAPDGSAEIAVQFHSAHADRFKAVYQSSPAPPTAGKSDRRNKNRVRMTLPIRVRNEAHAEESVTLDVSRTGVLFRSSRNYPVGEQVWVAMPYQPGAPPQEISARVVRVVERPEARGVALQFGQARPPRTSSYYA